MRGTRWRRNADTIAASFVSNGISDDHRDYLAVGGSGFLLGDGGLTYGRETIVEAYYNAHVWRGFFAAGDIQFIDNPGYNQDRGPAWVFSLRTHFEF
jgi:high affinity Mn2+ porin